MSYRDTWTRQIPPGKQAVYKTLSDKGVINDLMIVYVRSTGETIVEYKSDLPRPELVELMRRCCHGNV